MSWGSSSPVNATVHERAMSLVAAHRDVLSQQAERKEAMPKNKSGAARIDRDAADRAVSKWGELQEQLDEALDVIEAAMRRERLVDSANRPSASDVSRSSALRERDGAGR